MEQTFRIVKKIIPKKVFNFFQPAYHYLIAILGALIYRFPSREIKVIGVTGTKGKSSVSELVNAILENAGYKTALQNTIRFKIAGNSRRNLFKMTMPGRFFVQKFLRQAVNAGCSFAVIEISSEGARQFRHKFIDLNALIFTNLAPEHIESHGGYENYREAKLKIARSLALSPKKDKFMIGNTDDKETPLFFEAAKPAIPISFSLRQVEPYKVLENGVEFAFEGQKIISPLRGLFNIYNLLASAACAKVFDVPTEKIKSAVENLKEIPGRAQSIKNDFGFDVIVDYAHTSDSLRALYEAFKSHRKICILGNTGGGRDTWKRPQMGKIADDYCETIILTNEDPYDEDPREIVDDVARGIIKHEPKIIMDRREAVSFAIQRAQELTHKNSGNNVAVLITGKGTDPFIIEARGKKTPWDDAAVVKEELEKLLKAPKITGGTNF